MKLYLSGIVTALSYWFWEDTKYSLGSFLEMKKPKLLEFVKSWKSQVFLDSWWYTILKQWLKISVNDYADFLKEYWKYFEVIANMDTWDTKETLENQKILEATWNYILPVYHTFEYINGNRDLFIQYCKKYPYVALWGVVSNKLSKKELLNFFNYCFKIAMKYKTKLHWFWVTSNSLLRQYPFYSVDSTSWLMTVKYNWYSQFKNWAIYTVDWNTLKKQGIDIWAKWMAERRFRLSYNARVQYWDFIDKYWKLRWLEYWN